jgi:hypothetical protein
MPALQCFILDIEKRMKLEQIFHQMQQGARYLTGENLKLVWTGFSTLSSAVSLLSKENALDLHGLA